MQIYDGSRFITTGEVKDVYDTLINNGVTCVERCLEEHNDTIKYEYVIRLLKKLNSEIKTEHEAVWNLILSEIQNWPYDFKELIMKTHRDNVQIIEI